uniref:DUF4205 domain-containing protein n=1 Tax=Macrostomum lignano TaxID=282301 RepID=A0A1I8FA71_9PLAT
TKKESLLMRAAEMAARHCSSAHCWGGDASHFLTEVRNVDGPGYGKALPVNHQYWIFSLCWSPCATARVGWHLLKNPRYPVWIVGSETHLTVLFSNEGRTCIQAMASVERVFHDSWTPARQDFIPADKLDELIKSARLDLPEGCQNLSELKTAASIPKAATAKVAYVRGDANMQQEIADCSVGHCDLDE